ncbi:T9SS sorting signal type C domain-containing protein [Flavobacterium artemisiae]|uniref:T9SS sorting signal type C domain-containing protein n=1 Tax=Flavobacterium artemisiae TaxID=2126556 RepID=A0ABW4H831_9FLAO
MKKKLLSTPRIFQHFNGSLIASQLNYRKAISYKIFLPIFLFFISTFMYGQAAITHTFDTNNSVIVPNGLTLMNIQAWGGGGSGGGATNLPALQGRSGSGGGAGARATATITVTPGATISALVATAVSGSSGGDGTAGNFSTISGFQSFIYASGGAGGLANTAGNASYLGGAGGSTGAGTVTAGGNGGQGFTSALAVTFTSGAGGNSPGFTNGGASHTSVLGGVNQNGNPGGAAGGGGSGGIITNQGEVRAGGAGGAGRVIIGYTCPTYGFTSISAAPACVTSGTTVVTLTGPAVNLPVGSYDITYNRANPAGSNLPATLTVTTAGTGTFTASGFNVVGTNSTVTVTSIKSQACTSTISSGNTSPAFVVSAASVGGTIAGSSTICSGANSGNLTLSGQVGTVQKWQYSLTPFTSWVDIANTAGTGFVFGPLTQTVHFRAIVTNGACAEAISSVAIVTVNPLPQGSLTASGPFCVTGAGQLTFTATAGTGPYTVVYNDGTADRTVTGVVSGTPFNTFATPVTATTTYTLVSVTGANTCVRTTGFTGPTATITVNPLPQGSLTANGPFCETGAGQLTFTASAGTGPYTVVYNDGTANRTATGVVSGTPFNTFTTPVTATTTYTLVSVTGSNTCVRTTSFTGASATITVNPLPQGSLTANGPFCATGAGQLTFTASAGTGPYTVVYNDGTADRTATGVVSGTPFNTFTTPVTATTTYTLVSVTGSNTCVRTTGFTGASATITVNPLPQGSLTANGPFCVTGAGQLTFTASAGTGPYTVVYNDGTANRTASNVTSGTPFAVFTTPVTATTTYTLVSVTGVNTCVRTTGFTGASATITVNPLPQGSLTANGPFCATGAGQLTFTASAGTGPYTVVYNDGTADRTATGVVSGTPFNTFTTPVTGTTTYTLVSVTGANTCVRTTGFTGASATITVNPLPQGTLTANGPFCVTGAGQLTFTASAGTGPFTVVYNDGTANRTASNVTSGTPFAVFTTPVTTTTTYTLVSVTGANTCVRTTGFTGASATITVNPLPQGSLTANGPFCVTGAGQLTFTATAGTGPYTVVYNDGTADRTATGVVSGTPFNTFTTPVTATTTYTLVSVTGANTCVRTTGFTGASATITVNPLPQGTLTANGPFCATGAGQLTFTASAGTGPYTIVYNDGTADRTATGVVSGTPFNTFTTPVTGTTTYTLVSVTGANTCVRTTGFTGASATITVNPLPQGTLTANGPFCVTGAGQLTFTASAGTGPFTVVYNDGTANRTASNVTSGTPFAVFTTPVTGTTTYTLVSVTGANSCVRTTGFTAASATITVNPLPQGTLTANGPFCATGAGQLTFTASAGTGPYTVVYNDGTANRTASNVISGTSFAVFTTPVTSTTTYTLVSVTGANTCVRTTGFTGASATITVNPLPQGSLTANGPFCATGAGQLTFTASAGTGPYTVVYNDGTANRTASNVTSGTPFNTFTTPVTGTTTYTLVSVTGANTCVRTTGFTGASATITINPTPAPSFTTQPGSSVCVNTFVTYTTQAGQTNYIWTVSGTLGADYNVVSGSLANTSNSVTLEWFTLGNKTVTVGYTSLGCPSSVSASNTTDVIRTVRGVVNGGTLICSGSPSPLLTLNGYTGTIVRWEYAEAIPYVWQPISHTGNTYQPGILTTSTSYRAVVKNGSCTEEGAIETRIDIEPKPSTPSFGTILQPTCVTGVGSVVLTGLPSASNWTITQTGTVNQTYTSSGTSYTINNLAPGNYTFTVYNIAICNSDPTPNLEIIAPITNIWNGTSWSKGSAPTITDAIRFSGNYSTTGNLNGCSVVVDPGVTVTVNSNHTLTITNSVTNSGGNFIFENNASLYQTTDAVNTGNIVYKRKTNPVRRYDFTYWSSPVTRTPGFTLKNLSPATLGDKYYKYNALSGWVISYNGIDVMGKGIGYSVRAPQTFDINTPSVYDAEFIGIPNNGPASVPLMAAEKWSLIGNPYPSAVYADQFIVDNQTNLYGTLYFWTHNSLPTTGVPGDAQYNYTESDYAIYNLSGSTVPGNMEGDGATTPGNQAEPLGYIAAGQSFFAKSKTAGSAVFTNTMRVAGNNSQFYKPGAVIERHRVWLNLLNTQGAFKQLLIGYVEGATNFWDNNYDAVTMDANKYLDFYSINENRKLVIQGRALPFNNEDIIPLGYRSAIVGEFNIEIDHADGLLNSTPIYLEDKKMGVVHNLQKSSYTFKTEIGTFTDRFLLRFGSETLGEEEFEKTGNNVYVSVKDNTITVSSETLNENLRDIMVYDVSGKLLFTKKAIGETQFSIENFQVANQVLILKIILENGSIKTTKVIF